MRFNASREIIKQNALSMKYLTENLTDIDAGHQLFDRLVENLGCAIESYPMWHPLMTTPGRKREEMAGRGRS